MKSKQTYIYPEWFFMWTKPETKQHITALCAWHKTDLVAKAVETLGQPWSEIFAAGGRVVRVNILPVEVSRSRKP